MYCQTCMKNVKTRESDQKIICESCGCTLLRRCLKCDQTYEPYTFNYCKSCDESYCASCSQGHYKTDTRCSECSSRVCDWAVNNTSCSRCDFSLCSTCYEDQLFCCEVCQFRYCDPCYGKHTKRTTSCASCSTSLCALSHVINCATCPRSLCEYCASMDKTKCSVCTRSVCGYCTDDAKYSCKDCLTVLILNRNGVAKDLIKVIRCELVNT